MGAGRRGELEDELAVHPVRRGDVREVHCAAAGDLRRAGEVGGVEGERKEEEAEEGRLRQQ